VNSLRSRIPKTKKAKVAIVFLFILLALTASAYLFHNWILDKAIPRAYSFVYKDRVERIHAKESEKLTPILSTLNINNSVQKTYGPDCYSFRDSEFSVENTCMSSSLYGQADLDVAQRTALAKNAWDIEHMLDGAGWKGSGWISNIAYNINASPGPFTQPGGIYTKEIKKTKCELHINALYSGPRDTYALITSMQCVRGKISH
jgi:hypothetical protein